MFPDVDTVSCTGRRVRTGRTGRTGRTAQGAPSETVRRPGRFQRGRAEAQGAPSEAVRRPRAPERGRTEALGAAIAKSGDSCGASVFDCLDRLPSLSDLSSSFWARPPPSVRVQQGLSANSMLERIQVFDRAPSGAATTFRNSSRAERTSLGPEGPHRGACMAIVVVAGQT